MYRSFSCLRLYVLGYGLVLDMGKIFLCSSIEDNCVKITFRGVVTREFEYFLRVAGNFS